MLYAVMTRQFRYSRIQLSCSMSAERFSRICEMAEKKVQPNSKSRKMLIIMLYYQHPREDHGQANQVLDRQMLMEEHDRPDLRPDKIYRLMRVREIQLESLDDLLPRESVYSAVKECQKNENIYQRIRKPACVILC